MLNPAYKEIRNGPIKSNFKSTRFEITEMNEPTCEDERAIKLIAFCDKNVKRFRREAGGFHFLHDGAIHVTIMLSFLIAFLLLIRVDEWIPALIAAIVGTWNTSDKLLHWGDQRIRTVKAATALEIEKNNFETRTTANYEKDSVSNNIAINNFSMAMTKILQTAENQWEVIEDSKITTSNQSDNNP